MKEKEMESQYGDILVRFSSYYKYNFVFKGSGLTVYAGADKDDIYRLSVAPNKDYRIRDLPVYRIFKGEELIYEAW